MPEPARSGAPAGARRRSPRQLLRRRAAVRARPAGEPRPRPGQGRRRAGSRSAGSISRGGQPIVDLGRADNARDVVGALIADRGLRPTFRDRHRAGGPARDRATRARRRLAPRPDRRADLHRRSRQRPRLRRRRLGPSGRATGSGSGSTSPTSPPTSKPESGLDREAFQRANSTYAPGTVSPMLPGSLSSDACSLKPGVERLAVTAEIELRRRGEARSASFYRSRIRSDARLDYDHLDRIFAGTRARSRSRSRRRSTTARAAAAAIAALQRRSGPRGDAARSPSSRSRAEGDVAGAHALVQTEAHRLIEKLMILTNEQVALLLERKRRADALPRPRAARPGAGSGADRPARLARRPDAGAGRGRRPERGRARRRSRRAAWSRPRRSGAVTARAASRRSCSGR